VKEIASFSILAMTFQEKRLAVFSLVFNVYSFALPQLLNAVGKLATILISTKTKFDVISA
jgi:hypothetical protein